MAKKKTVKSAATDEQSGLPSLKKALLITIAFVAGASIMIVELAANRVLAPMFGNSLYTWTGLIGVILIAISAGYYFGGWLVDRRPDFSMLFILLICSSGLVCAIPLLQSLITEMFSKANLIWGPVACSLILFALPGILLGAVSPFTMRLISLLDHDQRIGLSVGRIGMFATFGSVVGTFLTGFVLIPAMDVRTIFLLVGGIIAALALVQWILFRKNQGAGLAGLVLLPLCVGLLSGFFGNAQADQNVIFEKNTYYHRIRVMETQAGYGDKLVTLFLDTTQEGAQYQNKRNIPFRYQRYWELSTALCDRMGSALFLGGGAFLMPESLVDRYPEANVDVVEIDPEVVNVGRRFFRLDQYPAINVVADDARRFLNLSEKKYDLIFGDAYNGFRYVPFHLVTVEFFSQVKNRLQPGGIYMMNLISALKGEDARFFQSITHTLNRVFEHVYVFSTHPRGLELTQNVILVGSDHPLEKTIESPAEGSQEVRALLQTYIYPRRYSYQKAPVFTDNFNPVEYLIARSLDRE